MREFETIKRVEGKVFALPVKKLPPPISQLSSPDWEMVPDEAMKAMVENLKDIYRTHTVEMAEEVILAALPHMLAESWDSGFRSVSEGNPNRPITNKVIEAAAQAIFSFCGEGWERLTPMDRFSFRGDAELALVATVQHLPVLTEIFKRGADAAMDVQRHGEPATNPYKIK
jgi:hypothetical protein